MRWIILLVTLTQTGCAVYTAASTVTYLATDKTITDHALTGVTPNGDCNAANLFKGRYYCEIRDISVTYNRSPL